jgi:DNA (cytosine-5)-methyltransferase 1
MFKYIDLFAGCGGLSEGFEQTGLFDGVAHVEWDKRAAKTLENRLATKWGVKNANSKVINFDIQRVEELIYGTEDEEYGECLGIKHNLGKSNHIDLLIGGPPCQAYSIAGRIRDENGMQDDYRNFLFESYVEIMRWCKPDIFLFENVKGILSAAPGGIPIIQRIHKSFDEAGYVTLDNFKDALFNLEEYGIPQKRSRVIIIGLKKNTYDKKGKAKDILKKFYDEFKINNKIIKQVSSLNALKGLTKFHPLAEGEKDQVRANSHGPLNQKFLNHTPRFHSKRDIEIFSLLAKDIEDGTNKYSTTDSLKNLYTNKTGKKSSVHKYHVIRRDLPSNTIPAHLYKDGLRHIHWDSKQARSITVREAARLQTFPDDFEFLGSMGDQYKMIGNAVPPLFSNLLASNLVRLLKIR